MIDAHVHVWTLDTDRYPWQPTLPHVPIPQEPATVEQLLDEMAGSGVEAAVLVQPSVYGWDNAYLVDALRTNPGRFAGVCLVDPHADDAAAQLRRWCEQGGCRGVRVNLIAEAAAESILEPRLEPLWAEASRLGASASLQMRPDLVPPVVELARRHRSLRIVVDYLGPAAFHDPAGVEAIRALGAEPNVWYKLLALGTDAREDWPFRDLWPLYAAAAEHFGTGRLVYGTDFPHVYGSGTYEQGARWLQELPFLDAAGRHAIAIDNPRLLWGLGPAGGGPS